MRYENTVKVEPKVFRNLKEFCKGKSGDCDIFDKITVSFNIYLVIFYRQVFLMNI